MRQLPLALGSRAERTFDNFQPGANAAAIAHLRALGAAAAPAYLWGPAGCGKTHLLQALAGQFAARGARAGWFGAAASMPWSFDDGWALVVIDDCERLDAGQQHAAFALFVEAATNGVPVVAAGRVPPVDLPLREDLRTRLGWGHVFAVEPLVEAEVRATLRREADRRGVFLSDDVLNYLLTRFERDLGHLMALLDRLDEFSLVSKRTVTVPLLKDMLAQQGPA
jgi:DnaA family protein